MCFVHLLLRQSIKLHRSYIRTNLKLPLCLRPIHSKHLVILRALHSLYVCKCVRVLCILSRKLYTNRKHKYNVWYKYLFVMQKLESFGLASVVLCELCVCRAPCTRVLILKARACCNVNEMLLLQNAKSQCMAWHRIAIYAKIYCKNIVWRSFETFTSFIWLDYPHFAFAFTFTFIHRQWWAFVCVLAMQPVCVCVYIFTFCVCRFSIHNEFPVRVPTTLWMLRLDANENENENVGCPSRYLLCTCANVVSNIVFKSSLRQ